MIDYRLVAAFTSAATFDILLPVAVALWLHRRFNIPWRYLLYGALVFFLSQVVTRLPAVAIIEGLFGHYFRESTALMIVWIAILAISAGVFEEVGRYLGYKYLFKDGKTWRNALMYGVGHGGLEAVLLGALVLFTLIDYVAISNLDVSKLPPAQAEQVRQAKDLFTAMPWWEPLLGAFERAAALIMQISFSVIVLQCFLRQNILWLVAAIAYHALVDFVAPLAGRLIGPLAAEGFVALFAALSLYLIFRLGEKREEPEEISDLS